MDNPPLTDPKMWRAVIIAEDTAASVPSCRHVLETTPTPTNYVSLQARRVSPLKLNTPMVAYLIVCSWPSMALS